MAAAISAPADNGTYTLGQVVPTSFDCGDASGAPATGSCTDSNGRSGGNGTLDTGTVGAHTYAVTATSASGQTLTRAIGYTVTPPDDGRPADHHLHGDEARGLELEGAG